MGSYPAFSPLPTMPAVIFCHLHPKVTPSFPLRNVMLCVARTFLSTTVSSDAERQAAQLAAAKLQNIEELDTKGGFYKFKNFNEKFLADFASCRHLLR